MCGIATVAIGRRARGRVPYTLLRRLVEELMGEIQVRGVDASGIAVINEGAESRVFKKPLRAERFIVRPMFGQTLGLIGPETNFIMLHSRATTRGSTSDNFNNHPIITEPIVGIHNGTLWNEDRLFSKYASNFEREGDVDSEIIFKLYMHFIDQGISPQQALVETSDELSGAFTGALVDMRDPHRMMIFKNDRALCIFTLPHYDMIITVSEARFYDNAARRLGIKAHTTCEYIEDGTGITFDLNLPERITNHIHAFELPVARSYVRHHRTWLASV